MFQVASPNASFINIWIDSYKNYEPHHWSFNSVLTAHNLAAWHKDLVHIEQDSFNHPTWQHEPLLYYHHYNYTNNYSIHLYFKSLHYIPGNESELAGYDCTVGNAMREVLYDSPKLRSKVKTKGVSLSIKNKKRHIDKDE